MRAVTWHGARDIRVDNVADPVVEDGTDIVIRVTSSALCGSDLHLYEVLAPLMEPGDIVGDELMGIVEAVGADVPHLDIGDRVVLGVESFATHHLPLEEAPEAYATFQKKEDGAVKIVFRP